MCTPLPSDVLSAEVGGGLGKYLWKERREERKEEKEKEKREGRAMEPGTSVWRTSIWCCGAPMSPPFVTPVTSAGTPVHSTQQANSL